MWFSKSSGGLGFRNALDEPIDLPIAVRRGQEEGLVLRRRDVDAPVEETAEERRVVIHEERRHRSCAPPLATRKPVITSSKTSRAPLASHSRLRPSRKPSAGGTTPMFPGTGSTKTHAAPSISRSTASRSL